MTLKEMRWAELARIGRTIQRDSDRRNGIKRNPFVPKQKAKPELSKCVQRHLEESKAKGKSQSKEAIRLRAYRFQQRMKAA